MTTYRIDPDRRSKSYRDEERFLRTAGMSDEGLQRRLSQLKQCASVAKALPGGYIRKNVWDKESGHPEHSWGYVQYSPRPYRQGYGCDGTTDENVHLIASVVCERLGIDYVAAYAEAYAEDTTLEDAVKWLGKLRSNKEILTETILPDGVSDEVLMLALSDLYQINNRSLVCVLEEKFEAIGRSVSDWYKHEDRLRRKAA